MDLDLTTESRNPNSTLLDQLSTRELVRLFNREDSLVANAVADQEAAIADAVDVIAQRMQRGGRLVYIGAGTSGRLGVLDAAECPPTFNTRPGQVIGLIAGGDAAMLHAVEGAEDSPHLARQQLAEIGLGEQDAVVGIAASGRTPYVLGGLAYARGVSAATVGLTCNAGAEIEAHADITIAPVVGPEVLAGSTRLKAGTATKMVLNTLSTGVMVRLGKTYGNLMVDLRATNSKLACRSLVILREITGVDEERAHALLDRCGGELKTAIVSELLNLPAAAARERIASCEGNLRRALELL